MQAQVHPDQGCVCSTQLGLVISDSRVSTSLHRAEPGWAALGLCLFVSRHDLDQVLELEGGVMTAGPGSCAVVQNWPVAMSASFTRKSENLMFMVAIMEIHF